MENKTIEDIMVCPKCGSNDCYEFGVDEVDFNSTNPHYSIDCHCKNCNIDFRLRMTFSYQIKEYSARY